MNTNIVKTHISNGYRWRLLLITLMMLGFGAYCVYDWKIGYPKVKEIGLAYQKIKAENPDDYAELWPAFAQPRGWPTTGSKIKLKSESEYDKDILTQLLMALITIPLGLLFLFKVVKEHCRWVAIDEQGITASGGHTVPWDAIQSLDETRWKSKGIAWLHYADSRGRGRKILLDDYKQEPEAVKYIVAAVQNVLNPGAGADDQASADLRAQEGETPPDVSVEKTDPAAESSEA